MFDTEFVFQRFQQVEIDEAYIKWKYKINPGDSLFTPTDEEGDWVLGLISRDRNKIWLLPLGIGRREN